MQLMKSRNTKIRMKQTTFQMNLVYLRNTTMLMKEYQLMYKNFNRTRISFWMIGRTIIRWEGQWWENFTIMITNLLLKNLSRFIDHKIIQVTIKVKLFKIHQFKIMVKNSREYHNLTIILEFNHHKSTNKNLWAEHQMT